jgi:hypothetical protein
VVSIGVLWYFGFVLSVISIIAYLIGYANGEESHKE